MVILDLGYLEETSEKSQFTLNVVGGSQVYTDATADNNTAEAVAAGIGDLVFVFEPRIPRHSCGGVSKEAFQSFEADKAAFALVFEQYPQESGKTGLLVFAAAKS